MESYAYAKALQAENRMAWNSNTSTTGKESDFWKGVDRIDENAFAARQGERAALGLSSYSINSDTPWDEDISYEGGAMVGYAASILSGEAVAEGSIEAWRLIEPTAARLITSAGRFWAREGTKAAEDVTSGKYDDFINKIQQYLGEGMKVEKPEQGSDLVLRSADRTKQIRFDITYTHGLEPHVNVERWAPKNLYPGDRKMIEIENIHIFPENDLEEQNVPVQINTFKQ